MKHLILKFRKLRQGWGDGLWLGALVLTESPALIPSTISWFTAMVILVPWDLIPSFDLQGHKYMQVKHSHVIK